MELVVVIAILGVLSVIAVPLYEDQTSKARLTELLERVHAMQVAMQIAYDEGNPAVFSFSSAGPGTVPDTLREIINDNMEFPPLTLELMVSDLTFHQFTGGAGRPYLVIGAKDLESAKVLRDLSEIYPDESWAWWSPSTVMVVPLLEATPPPGSTAITLGTQQPAGLQPVSTPPATVASGSQTSSKPQPQTATTSSQSLNPPGNSQALVHGNPQGTPFQLSSTGCTHPGNGHAFGRCGN